ncbi:hypothetical protein GDO81_003188 [Engystomops pustulosus]|uniref:Uncharacterized protein n=1 Tax=Engystomops pustulosus TaxID=76066 RepID=A0AAV7A220_ENGPU|nr:hypothetical protein GDO81_003188 [Engystomops pustulosus]
MRPFLICEAAKTMINVTKILKLLIKVHLGGDFVPATKRKCFGGSSTGEFHVRSDINSAEHNAHKWHLSFTSHTAIGSEIIQASWI